MNEGFIHDFLKDIYNKIKDHENYLYEIKSSIFYEKYNKWIVDTKKTYITNITLFGRILNKIEKTVINKRKKRGGVFYFINIEKLKSYLETDKKATLNNMPNTDKEYNNDLQKPAS